MVGIRSGVNAASISPTGLAQSCERHTEPQNERRRLGRARTQRSGIDHRDNSAWPAPSESRHRSPSMMHRTPSMLSAAKYVTTTPGRTLEYTNTVTKNQAHQVKRTSSPRRETFSGRCQYWSDFESHPGVLGAEYTTSFSTIHITLTSSKAFKYGREAQPSSPRTLRQIKHPRCEAQLVCAVHRADL